MSKGNRGNRNPPPAYQFKPGQSGNPGGRPKKRPITERYAAVLEMPLPEELRAATKLPEGATYGDAVALAQMREAIKGKTQAACEIREAIEGKATQRTEVTGSDGTAIKVETKLSAGDLIGALREIYGLSDPPNSAQSADSVPVPAPVGERSKPPEDSR